PRRRRVGIRARARASAAGPGTRYGTWVARENAMIPQGWIPAPARRRHLAVAVRAWVEAHPERALGRPVQCYNGQCLDVAGAGTANGTNIQVWPCNGTASAAATSRLKGRAGAPPPRRATPW